MNKRAQITLCSLTIQEPGEKGSKPSNKLSPKNCCPLLYFHLPTSGCCFLLPDLVAAATWDWKHTGSSTASVLAVLCPPLSPPPPPWPALEQPRWKIDYTPPHTQYCSLQLHG